MSLLSDLLKQADTATQGVEVGNGEFTPIKPGIYEVAVTESELTDSKRANPDNPAEHGKLIKMKLTITSGEFNGRTVIMRNNLIVYPVGDEKSQKAMAIGKRERQVILDSLGKAGVEEAAELIGATFKAQIGIKPYDGKTYNEVIKVMPLNAPAKPVASATPSATASTAAKPAKAKMPWEK